MADWKLGDPVPENSEEAMRRRFGDWNRRRREDAGFNQADAAAGLGISQSALSRMEATGVASEEVLERLWVLYRVPEQYPDAPRDPVRRRVYMGRRNVRGGREHAGVVT